MRKMWTQLIVTNHPVASQPWFEEDGVLCMRDLLNYILEESHCAMVDGILSLSDRGGILAELLIRASSQGNVLVVSYMLSRIFPLTYFGIRSDNMDSAIESAVAGNHMEVVNSLLAVMTARDMHPSSAALQIAVRNGSIKMVERLLRANADVNGPRKLFDTASGSHWLNALQLAASSGSLDIVEMLLLAGAEVNAPAAGSAGLTALQAAALHGPLNVVRRLLSSHADVNAVPAAHHGYTVMQAAETSNSSEILELLLKPLGVIQVLVESARKLPLTSYTQIIISGIEMARTRTAIKDNPDNPWTQHWDEVLYVPLCYATAEILILVIDQDSRRKDPCLLLGVTPISELVVETGGTLKMRQPLRRTYPGADNARTIFAPALSCVISFYPCLTPGAIYKEPDDDEKLKPEPSFMSRHDIMRLTSLDGPGIAVDEFILYPTGFIMFHFLSWTTPPDPSSTKIQVLVDDLRPPSYSQSIARFKILEQYRIGNCFIRGLHSSITFRLRQGSDQSSKKLGMVLQA